MNHDVLNSLTADMKLADRSPVTIEDRIEVLDRLSIWLEVPLIDATADQLRDYQDRFKHLAPASIDIYTRHIQAFYRWALGRGLIAADPSVDLIRPRLRKGRPHPTTVADLRIIFTCTSGALRIVYALAVFAGLRRGEICRLHRRDLDFGVNASAVVDGKGGKERVVPLLPPLISELAGTTGWVVTRNGLPYPVEQLSVDSGRHLRRLGIDTTLHSMRHTFATTAYRQTHDLLLVQRLLGHESVSSTQIYAEPDMSDAHARLSGFTAFGSDVLAPRHLRIVV